MLPEIEITRIDGSCENLQDYQDTCLLIVNVASKCGFTSQYAQFQSTYEELKDKKFEILAFPCNQFGAQEPGSSDEIVEFCESKYDISFPVFEKIEVNGSNTHPLYKFLKSEASGVLGSEAIKWNFTKFLLDRNGKVMKRFAPQTTIADIRKYLMPLLLE
jgi:glutathione peroxidase